MEQVKGFNDFSGEEAEKREGIRKILVATFEKFGFEPAETPIVEYEEFVRGNEEQQNDEAISDIFKLKDKGERNLALRYEFTFQLKRLANNKKIPYKRYQIGYVFRDEPVSSNRFRQFTQCDADIIGSSVKDEAEILALAKQVFEKLGIRVVINFNNRKLLNEILEESGIIEKNRNEVIRILDKLDKQPESEIKKELKKFNGEKVLKLLKNPGEKIKKFQSYREIEELEKYCKFYGVKVNFLPSLARGLSYYNGSVFEIKTAGKESKETICAGGGYLVNGMQSTGISFGLERISSLSKLNMEKNGFLVVSLGQDKESIKLAQELRKNGENVVIYYGKPSKALEYANAKAIGKVVFIGENEVKKKKFKVKDMKTGKESELKIKLN